MERDKCVGYAGAYKETDAAYILIRSNKMQQYAGIYLLQNYSTCFGFSSHPSLWVHQTVNAASGTGHTIWATTFRQRGLIRSRRKKVVAQILWPVPEAAVTVYVLLKMGAIDTRNMYSNFAVNKQLHTVASRLILLIYVLWSGCIAPRILNLHTRAIQ